MFQHKNGEERRSRGAKRTTVALLTAVLLIALAVGGTVAWLTAGSDSIVNTFEPTSVSCAVSEQFDGTTKSDVAVQNTGSTAAYVRVRLVSYRVDAEGNQTAGAASVPTFTPGENWVLYDGCYYYTLPVGAGDSTACLIDSITLTTDYADEAGGRQALDVLAEAVQASPAEAVGSAWGVSISQGSVAAYGG